MLFAGTSAMAQTSLTASQLRSMMTTKSYGQVSVHDPSVYYDASGDRYYVIGSHMGLATSSDLVNYSSVSTGTEHATLLGKSYSQAFASNPIHEVQVTRDGVTTTDTLGSFDAGAFCATYAGIKVGDREATTEASWISGDMWAPDMVYNETMQKWCMYLSLNGDYWASVIILLTSDQPTGPFTYQGPIVFSGFNGQTYSGTKVDYKDTDLELVLGELSSLPSRYNTSSWGTRWPNCIDPCAFFDDEGEMWLAYGSWSGGICILKLDKTTGLRDYTTTYSTTSYGSGSSLGYSSDAYFGKQIAGGKYVSGEGPYIQKIGSYYYLFMSYGGYAPDGGYEMRVFRSDSPDGTYKDALGNVATYTTYAMNYGPSATTNKGMKLLGAMNQWGTMTVGETAEGHNSAIDNSDGDAFLVDHTKFNDGTVGHQVRTRQLFLNEKNWLVASPFLYTGKQTTQAVIDSTQLFSADSVAGTYQLLIHPYRLDYTNMEESTPVTVTLTADGNISGDRTGTWKYSEDGKSYVTLVINNSTYYGVALDQAINGYSDMQGMCFTAVSNTGVPVWLYKYQPASAVAYAYSAMQDYLGTSLSSVISTDAPVIDNVTSTFEVKNTSTQEPDSALSADGKFTPTTDGHRISIYYTLTSGGYYFTTGPINRYTLQAEEDSSDENTVYYPESSQKNTTAGWWTNFSTESYVLEAGQSYDFQFYNYTNEANNWSSWCLYGASAMAGASDYTEYFGVRNDFWDNTTASNTGCTADFDWDTFTSDMNGSLVNMTVSYTAEGVFTMTSTITTTAGKTYSYSYTKTIDSNPSSLTLFFVSEGSYIDGSSLTTGVNAVAADKTAVQTGKIYNLSGQQVDESYHGIVIVNGKKVLR